MCSSVCAYYTFIKKCFLAFMEKLSFNKITKTLNLYNNAIIASVFNSPLSFQVKISLEVKISFPRESWHHDHGNKLHFENYKKSLYCYNNEIKSASEISQPIISQLINNNWSNSAFYFHSLIT